MHVILLSNSCEGNLAERFRDVFYLVVRGFEVPLITLLPPSLAAVVQIDFTYRLGIPT